MFFRYYRIKKLRQKVKLLLAKAEIYASANKATSLYMYECYDTLVKLSEVQQKLDNLLER